MKEKERKLQAKLIETIKKIVDLNKERVRLLSELAECSPHVVGEIVFVKEKDKVPMSAVMVKVYPMVKEYPDTDKNEVYYDYEFKYIKKNGDLCKKQFFLKEHEYLWTGLQYEQPTE